MRPENRVPLTEPATTSLRRHEPCRQSEDPDRSWRGLAVTQKEPLRDHMAGGTADGDMALSVNDAEFYRKHAEELVRRH